MTPDQALEYLTRFVNKAVQQGGFNAQEASTGLTALDALKQKLDFHAKVQQADTTK